MPVSRTCLPGFSPLNSHPSQSCLSTCYLHVVCGSCWPSSARHAVRGRVCCCGLGCTCWHIGTTVAGLQRLSTVHRLLHGSAARDIQTVAAACWVTLLFWLGTSSIWTAPCDRFRTFALFVTTSCALPHHAQQHCCNSSAAMLERPWLITFCCTSAIVAGAMAEA